MVLVIALGPTCSNRLSAPIARRSEAAIDAGGTAEQTEALTHLPFDVLADMARERALLDGHRVAPRRESLRAPALISQQSPVVPIFGCSYFLLVTDIIFDHGFGHILFRVAGTALDTATLEMLQYVMHHLIVKVLIAIGHELCCAVKAAQLSVETAEKDMPTQLHEAMKSQGGRRLGPPCEPPWQPHLGPLPRRGESFPGFLPSASNVKDGQYIFV